jgi:hypothetical protein
MTINGPYGYIQGWNTKTGPWDCPQDGYVDAQNIELVYGHAAKSNGNIQWTTGTHPGGAGQLEVISYFQSFLVVSKASKIATASPTAVGAWTDITGAVTYTPTTGLAWSTALNNILVLGGPNTNPVQWTGTGNCTALGGSPPYGANAAATCNNYMFMGGSTTYPHRVWWSNVIDPNTWPATSYTDVKPDDSAHFVTALYPFGEDLLIFKDNCIARFYTNQLSGTLGPLVILTEKFGCEGQRCVARMPDGRIAFVGYNNHVYIYDGNTFQDISDQPTPGSNIQSIFNALTFKTAGILQGGLKVYQAKNQIWISYPFTWVSALGTSYTAGVIFKYDYVAGVWLSPYPDHRVFDMINYVTGNKEYFISAGSSYLFQEDTGSVNNDPTGNATLESYVTKSIPFSADSKMFTPRSLMIPINSASFNGALYYGQNGYNNPASSVTFSYTNTVATDYKKVFALSSKSGGWNTGQFRFDGALSNQSFAISPFYLSDQIEAQT